MKNVQKLKSVALVLSIAGIILGVWQCLRGGELNGYIETDNIVSMVMLIVLVVTVNLFFYFLICVYCDHVEAICQIRDVQMRMSTDKNGLDDELQKASNTAVSKVKTAQVQSSVTKKTSSCPHCGNAPTSSPCEMCGKTF